MTQVQMTETDLLSACLKHDRMAQKELYERYKNAMYTLCYRITGNFTTADDVLQEAFVKVFKNLASFRAESTLGAWIKTIVIRTAYAHLRKKKIFTEPIDQVPLTDHLDWGNFHFETEYLEKAILALPEGYRLVFTLIEIEGYAHKEVAEKLDISIGTSKSQLFYAKKRLRESLIKYGYER